MLRAKSWELVDTAVSPRPMIGMREREKYRGSVQDAIGAAAKPMRAWKLGGYAFPRK
jgi:hypothetical protein